MDIAEGVILHFKDIRDVWYKIHLTKEYNFCEVLKSTYRVVQEHIPPFRQQGIKCGNDFTYLKIL